MRPERLANATYSTELQQQHLRIEEWLFLEAEVAVQSIDIAMLYSALSPYDIAPPFSPIIVLCSIEVEL